MIAKTGIFPVLADFTVKVVIKRMACAMKYFFESIKNIPFWRVILAAVLLFCMAYGSYSALAVYGQPSIQETILIGLNNVTTMLFYVILLLVVSDFGFKNNRPAAKTSHKKYGNALVFALIVCLVFETIYIVSCFLILLLTGGSIKFADMFTDITLNGLEWMSPTPAMVISIFLFFLRFVFLTCLVTAINSRSRKAPYGYAAGFAVCLIDAIAYYHFGLSDPIGVFPFEHSFLESALRLTRDMPLDIIISVLYWFALIATAGFIYDTGIRKNPDKEVRLHESHHF